MQIEQEKGVTAKMDLIYQILSDENLNEAIKQVKSNKGAQGIDGMKTEELDEWFKQNKETLKNAIMRKRYFPNPVRRVYIPKANGKQRPLGIPTVVDRVIQQAIAQVLSSVWDSTFSEHSWGFRPGRSAHDAVHEALEALNQGCEWMVDLDIEKFFDRVNHDKLISIIREKVNEDVLLHLIRKYLNAGVMENKQLTDTIEGVPQGGPLSPLLANIYLDKFDKELERRGLKFARYADDVVIFVKSERAADRVMKSVSEWLKRKLFLDVSPTKTKVVRPSNGSFLGFGFWKGKNGWECKPLSDRKTKLKDKVREVLTRKKAAAVPLGVTFTKLNQIIRGWINYYSIGSMSTFLKEFTPWLQHKVRVVIFKQWKMPKTIYRNLKKLNKMQKRKLTNEEIYATANSRLGLYRKTGLRTTNFLISPSVLRTPNKKKGRPGLIDPVAHYLRIRAKIAI